MTKIYASFLFVLFFVGTAEAQLQILFNDVTVQAAGDTANVDVSVRNFQGIVTIQTSINWDPSKFKFADIVNFSSVVPDFSADVVGTPPNAAAVNDGQVTIVWSERGTNPVNVPDGTILFTLRLVAAGNQCDRATIDVSNVPRASEILNNNFSNIGVSGSPGTLLIDNGSTSCNTGSSDAVELSIGSISSPKGSQVCLPIKATNFNNIESFQFGLTWDPSVLSLATEDDPGMDGLKDGVLPKVSANAREADRGRLRVLWSLDPDPITASADDTLLEVCFNVIGETGSGTDVSFANFPDATPPWKIEVSVENKSLDFTLKSGRVSVGSGPDGGNGGDRDGVGLIFEDLYTEGASSICVPFKVENFDSLVAFMAGVGFDASVLRYTGSQNEINGLQVADTQKDKGELRVLWSDGNANAFSLDDGATVVELCFDVIGSANAKSAIGAINIPPNFPIEVLKFPENTTKFFVQDGSVTVGNRPKPLDTLTLTASQEVFAMGDTVCVDFTVDNFKDINGMSFTVTWDESILTYVEPRNSNLPQLSEGGSNFRFVDPNKVRVLYNTPTAQAVDNGTSIFQLCYVAIPDCDSDASTDIVIGGDTNAKLEFVNTENRVIPVKTNNGKATARSCETKPIAVTATQVRNPSCSGAPNGAIIIEVENAIGSFTCSWTKDGQTVVTDNCLLNGVTAGEYTVTVKDDNDSTATATFTLIDPSPLAIATATVDVCPVDGASDGAVTFTFSGGDGAYRITESGAGTVNGLSITGLRGEAFTFIVTDGKGCDMMMTYNGLASCGTGPIASCDRARAVISPNNDGVNDEFVIGCLNDPAERSKVNNLKVYNRWGELVYNKDGYANDWSGVGTDGQALSEGGYMWVFSIGGATDRKIYRGTVTILR